MRATHILLDLSASKALVSLQGSSEGPASVSWGGWLQKSGRERVPDVES